MKTLRKLQMGKGYMEVVEVPVPTLQKGEVLVEVRRAGVCGTDIHNYYGLYPKLRPPVTLGHEFCGVITEVGPNATGWKTGDRVTVDSRASSCGFCSFCRDGRTNLCAQRVGYGSNKDGGFASFVAVNQEALHRLPDHISFREGALCEPMACAVHAVMEISSLKSGDTVLITGPGPIGLLVLQVAKAQGGIVVITGRKRDEERLKLAHQFGADEWVQVENQELAPVVAKLTDGHGLDVAFECSGTAGGLNDCIQYVHKGGEIVQIGLSGHPAGGLNIDDIALKEIRIHGTFGHHRKSWETAIDLLEKRRLDLAPLVSGEFPLDQWLKAFQLFEEGKGFKYLLYPIA
jgi:L-iditol 2-dehydrogenase